VQVVDPGPERRRDQPGGDPGLTAGSGAPATPRAT
jgi:hypothetical protein